MAASESDLLIALGKARQDFAALQALFTSQKCEPDAQILAGNRNSPSLDTHVNLKTQIAAQFNALGCRLEAAEQLARQSTGAADASNLAILPNHHENRYKQIVDEQTDLICRYQSDFTLTFVNEAYAAMYQKRPEDLIGKSFLT